MKRILMFLVILSAMSSEISAQARRITGRVLDETGEGFPGAGISVQGTTTGTVTDVDGSFELDLPEGNNTITVQAVGYATQTLTVTGNTVTVNLTTNARELQGAVVTALAIRREKRELGYSATTLSTEELNSANQVSPLSAIQGKTAGVNITSTTGGPGGSTRVVLRGEKSISGNNNALIVVDGIPINNGNRLSGAGATSSLAGSSLEQLDFGNRGNDINPEDIESITVLKGPAAAALYGELGAFGAIMITTKSGRSRRTGTGKTEITFQSNYTLHNVLKFPELQNKYGQGNVFDIPDDRRENFSWGLPFDNQLRPWGQIINGQQMVKPYSAQPDNVRRFFNTGTTWENNVSIGSGGETGAFYLSLNSLNNKGIVPNTFYDKYSFRFNGATQLTNKFYANINVNYLHINQRVEASGQATGSVWDNVLQTPRDIPIWELKDYNNPFHSMDLIDSLGVQRYGYYGGYTLNPYWVADRFDNRSRTDRVLGSFTVGYQPDDNWNIFNRFGGDVIGDRNFRKTPKFNSIAFEGDPGQFYEGLPHISKGGYFEGTSNVTQFYNDFIIQYTRQLNTDLGLRVMAGHNLQMSRTDASTADIDPTQNGLVVPDFYNFSNAQGPIDATNSLVERRSVGVYGSLSFDFRRMLFLELTGRNDWSSTLRRGNWSYFYPSVNVSWVFTEMLGTSDFRNNILNYGKLRAGFAAVGAGAAAYQNNDPGYVSSIVETGFGTVRFPLQYSEGAVPGYTFQNTIGNQDLRPERTRSWEIGLETSWLRERISAEITYYYNKSVDQIVTVPTAPSTGYTARVINLGDISNRGIELSLRATPVNTASGFRWEIFGTYFKNVNNVDRLAEGVSRITLGGYSGMAITAAVGQPFGAFYATDLMTDPDGRVVVSSTSGLPLLSPDLVYKGSYQPKFIASWGTTLRFKGLSFNVLFDTKQGGKFYSRTKDILDFVGIAKETEDREAKIWPNSVFVGPNGEYVENTTVAYEPYNWFTSQIPAGQHILDASFVKLREASLYYTIPGTLLRRTPFGNAQIGLYGNNLFLWTARENRYVDPEVSSGGASNEQGFDFSARPSLRNYGMTLRVSF